MFEIINKLCIRKIAKTKRAFFSIIIIILLGVGVFVGINNTSLNMKKSLDGYLDDTNSYDIKLVSTLGLTRSDVEALKKLENVNDVQGTYSKDVIMQIGKEKTTIKLRALDDNINKVKLVNGKMPKNKDEILLDSDILKYNNIKIGDSVSTDENTYKVVGTVISPLHLNVPAYKGGRGNTNIGDGTINYFAYVLEDAIKENYYTEIYLTLVGAKEKETNSNEYNELVQNVEKDISKIEYENIKRRALEVYNSLSEIQKNKLKELNLISTDNIDELIKEKNIKWYITKRSDDTTYKNFFSTCDSIENLAKVFPVIFFVVAIFITSTNITRIVDEDRNEIGILKALGTDNKQIQIPYLIYSFASTFIGGVIGGILGFLVLPKIIWNVYQMVFEIPNYEITYNFKYVFLGIFISLIITYITTKLAIRKDINQSIPELTKAKVPKFGKIILLEKLPFLRKKLSLKLRIILRNIILYKKKIFITIIGTFGVTLLLFVGFSLKYSILGIAKMQYGKIFDIDLMIHINENIEEEQIKELLDNNEIESYQKIHSFTAKIDGNDISVKVLDEPYTNQINMFDLENGEKMNLVDNQVMISDKLAELANKHKGDVIEFTLSDNSVHKLKVSGVFENYWEHNMIMNKTTYEENFNAYSTNMITIKLKDNSNVKQIASSLLKDENVLSVITVEDAMVVVSDILKSLDKIVMVLVILSGALAIVVLYNIAVINISERESEIKTLKVLGMSDKKIDNYIIRETVILTFIGIVLALVFSKPIALYMIKRFEMQWVRYIYAMKINSYIYSGLLMILFLIITSIFTHNYLKKINMRNCSK